MDAFGRRAAMLVPFNCASLCGVVVIFHLEMPQTGRRLLRGGHMPPSKIRRHASTHENVSSKTYPKVPVFPLPGSQTNPSQKNRQGPTQYEPLFAPGAAPPPVYTVAK